MLKAKDLRDQKKEELMTQIDKIENELFQLKNKLKVERRVDKPHKVRELKRDKAKILTVLTEA